MGIFDDKVSHGFGRMQGLMGEAATLKITGSGAGSSITVVGEDEATARGMGGRNDVRTEAEVRRRVFHASKAAADVIGVIEETVSTLVAGGVEYRILRVVDSGAMYGLECELVTPTRFGPEKQRFSL